MKQFVVTADSSKHCTFDHVNGSFKRMKKWTLINLNETLYRMLTKKKHNFKVNIADLKV